MEKRTTYRLLYQDCTKTWYYIRLESRKHAWDEGKPLEFSDRRSAIDHVVRLYKMWLNAWNSYYEPSVLIESPDGMRTKHWFVGENDRKVIAQYRKPPT